MTSRKTVGEKGKAQIDVDNRQPVLDFGEGVAGALGAGEGGGRRTQWPDGADARPVHAHPRLTIVLPVYDEKDNLGPLYDRLSTVLTSDGASYEIVLVYDGSTDGSSAWLARPARVAPRRPGSGVRHGVAKPGRIHAS